MGLCSLDSIRPLYGFVDPHGGENRQSSARLKKIASQAAIVVGGRDDRNIYVVDAWADRCSTDTLVEKMFEMCEKWKLKSLGGEDNGMAGLFHDAVHREAKWRNKPLPIVRVTQPTNIHKDYRIRTALQPPIGHGRLILRSGLDQLVDQITAFPLSPHKDLVDALASLVRFIPSRPQRIERNRELNDKLRYLRNNGVAPDIIRDIAAGKKFA